MPSRRTVLLGVGSLFAASAGCATRGGGGNEVSTPTATPLGTPTGSGDASPTVENVVVRKAVRYQSLMGSGGVIAAPDEQYVVGVVSAETSLSPSNFAFEAAGESWAPGLPDTVGAVNGSVAGREGRPLDYGASESDRGAILAFAVPSPLSAPDPKIVFSGDPPAEWELQENARTRLAAPEARFELESLSVPDAVTEGQRLDVTLEVRNVSETDGRFLAALYWPTDLIADDDESTIVEDEIAAGEVATLTRSIDTQYTDNEDRRIDLRVEGHVQANRAVQFRTR